MNKIKLVWGPIHNIVLAYPLTECYCMTVN